MPAALFPRRRRSRRYLERAREYGQAAAALAALGFGDEGAPPFYMLIAHAMELGLKAVIAGGAVDDERLIIIGHDLPLCLRLADDRGLDLDPRRAQIEAIIDALAMPHLAQALRYPSYLTWPLPDAREALGALDDLLAQVDVLLAAPAGPTAH